MRSAQVVQRFLQRQAEVLLVERLPELRPDRLVELVGHHLHAGAERMAGADRAGQQIERLGKVLLELVDARRPLVLEDHRLDAEAQHERQIGRPPQCVNMNVGDRGERAEQQRDQDARR